MDREQEETVQHLTARYVSEIRAGYHPHLSDYLSRYPQYADAITDFVTYYHTLEVNIPAETETIPALSKAARVALDEAWKRLPNAVFEVNNDLNSLQIAAYNVGKSLMQLAVEIGLSQDILEKLDHHNIDFATIPSALTRCLAMALQQPLTVIETLLGFVKREQLVQGLAESQASYQITTPTTFDSPEISFQKAIEQSSQLSDELKIIWQSILKGEGLL